MIDVHDARLDAGSDEVLDCVYRHSGLGFEKSDRTSVNWLDLRRISITSSAGGLRVLAR